MCIRWRLGALLKMDQSYSSRDIVAIGGSAGAIEAISAILRGLPSDLPAALFVVVHISPQSPGYMPQIFSRAGPLKAEHARNGTPFRRGRVYVAPADHHLLLEPDETMRVVRGPKENRVRPAVDPLFRSAALGFGPRVTGIVVSGGLDDGTAGLRAIKMCGGAAVVQEPEDALASSMPATALRHVTIDYCRPAADIGPLVTELVHRTPVARAVPEDAMRKKLEIESQIAKNAGNTSSVGRIGEPSIFTCPECHGSLLRIRGESPWRYRCHTGHAFTVDSLLAELTQSTEEAIWNAVRSVQESAMLLGHLADHWRDLDSDVAKDFVRRSEEELARARVLREAANTEEILSEEKVEFEAKQGR